MPPRPPAWAPLEVAFTQVAATVRDQIAITRVEQEFYNPNARRLEGTFLFPVPKGAHLDKFTMEINGKPVEAELLAADKARGIYEDIVRKLRDPALLEYAGRDLFKARIFPIEPHDKKRITLAYTQLLPADAGLVNYVFPLNTEKFSAQPLKNLSVKIELESQPPLQSIYSPSHQVEVKRHGAHRATVGFESSNVKPDVDFQLLFAREAGDLAMNLMTCRQPGEDGYFLLLASPGVELKNSKILPKDVVFVLDTSGSMAGAKLEQAKRALAFCVENLNDEDRFEVLRFATETEPLFDKLTAVSAEHRSRAQKFIKGLRPIGGTAIDEALQKALSLRPASGDRPFVVIFLTDGRPTVGETDENRIVQHLTARKVALTRVFCFGIGTDVNTHLLDRVTEETRAYSQYVLPEEDLELKVSSFFTKIKEPVLTSPKVTFPAAIRATQLYPSPLPDLFKGEQLVLAGRYRGDGHGAIRIEGQVAGEARNFVEDVQFAREARDHEFIPRLWAIRRVGFLLDEIRLRGENKELKDEVTELARQYNIVTPYTAYLIVEDEARRGVAGNVRTLRLGEELQLHRQLADSSVAFERDRSGSLAVSGARSSRALKMAEAPTVALNGVRQESWAAIGPPAARTASDPATVYSAGRTAGGRGTAGGASYGLGPGKRVEALAQQSRFVDGRTFYLNDGIWVDAQIQKIEAAKRVRVAFGSPAYFDLLQHHPEAAAWLSIGPNVQLALRGTIYEIHDDAADQAGQ